MKQQHASSLQPAAAPVAPWRHWLFALILALVTAGVFWPATHAGFLEFDDQEYITSNPMVRRGLTVEGFRWAFAGTHEIYWHPLTWLSHMADVSAFGLDPSGHHRTNVLIHALNAGLAFLALRRLTGSTKRSALMAALFALHPLRVESVAWVAERKDLLSGLFTILTIWAYAAYATSRSKVHYALALLSFVGGVMSKPMVITLPFVLCLLDLWPLHRLSVGVGEKLAPKIRALLLEKLPFFAVTLVFALVTYFAQTGAGVVTSFEVLPMSARIANAIAAYATYLAKTVWPVNLAVLYPYRLIATREVVIALVPLLLFSAFAVKSIRTRPWFFTGWFWFIGMLVPVIGLVQTGPQALADRYTYLPSFGLGLVVVWAVAEIAGHLRAPSGLKLTAAAGAVVAFAVVARAQLPYWADTETLFRHAIKVAPKNPIALNALGTALVKRGAFDEAIAAYRQVIGLQPSFAQAHYNLGLALLQMGNLDGALELFTRRVEQAPKEADAHLNLGIVLEQMGRRGEAIVSYRKAMELQPRSPDILNNLAWLLCTSPEAAIRNGKEAVELALKAESITSGVDARMLDTLAAAHAEAGQFDRAVLAAKRAIAATTAARDGGEIPGLTAHLKQFEAGKPIREGATLRPVVNRANP